MSGHHQRHLKRARCEYLAHESSVSHRRSATAFALARPHDAYAAVAACWYIAYKFEDVDTPSVGEYARWCRINPNALLAQERRVLARVDCVVPFRTPVAAMDDALVAFAPTPVEQDAVVLWIFDLLASGLLPLRTPLAWMGIFMCAVRKHTVPVVAQAVACLARRPLALALEDGSEMRA